MRLRLLTLLAAAVCGLPAASGVALRAANKDALADSPSDLPADALAAPPVLLDEAEPSVVADAERLLEAASPPPASSPFTGTTIEQAYGWLGIVRLDGLDPMLGFNNMIGEIATNNPGLGWFWAVVQQVAMRPWIFVAYLLIEAIFFEKPLPAQAFQNMPSITFAPFSIFPEYLKDGGK